MRPMHEDHRHDDHGHEDHGHEDHGDDAACAVAHGDVTPATHDRTLVAVFASPVAGFLLRYGADLGYRTLLMEPDPARSGPPGVSALRTPPTDLDGTADVVVTDHHRDELGTVLRDLLAVKTRWIGVMGNPRHPGPHI